jgi:hypothetical protein
MGLTDVALALLWQSDAKRCAVEATGPSVPGTTTPLAKSGTNAVLSDDECIAIGGQALGAREAGIAHSTPVATRVYGQAEGTNSVEVASAPIGEKSDVLLIK